VGRRGELMRKDQLLPDGNDKENPVARRAEEVETGRMPDLSSFP